jgi:hypothetical protein
MPENSTTAIAVNVDVDAYVATPAAGGTYAFSPQDNTVRFRNIPANVAGVGLLVTLPANPSDGDSYELVDADGSCNLGHAISLIPAPGGTATIAAQNSPNLPNPLPSFTFANVNAGARMQFDSKHNQWLLWQSATGLYNAQNNFANLGSGGAVAPGNFAGGAAINLFAFLFPHDAGLGVFRLVALVNMIVAAADAGVILAVSVIPNVTAFSGGTLVGTAGNPQGRFETGTGAGQPVVITGDAGVPIGQWIEQVAAGDVGHVTAALTLDMGLPFPTNALAIGVGILVTLADTAQAITGIKVNASAQEIATGI